MIQYKLPRLLFITHQTPQCSYLQSITRALAGGCKFIQLRMKGAGYHEIKEVVHQALPLCKEQGALLTIDDHAELCLEWNLEGVHLGLNDMKTSEARKLLGPDVLIGGTANTFEDIQYQIAEGVDYIGLGPYQYTSTKTNLSTTLGLNGYLSIIQECRFNNIDIPIYAIGGINQADIPAILSTGVWGISLSSAILNAPNPIKETTNIIQTIDKSL